MGRVRLQVIAKCYLVRRFSLEVRPDEAAGERLYTLNLAHLERYLRYSMA